MAEPGGPKQENEIGSAFIRLGVTGATETKATLEAATKQAQAVGDAANKQTQATKQATAEIKTQADTFADLFKKVTGVNPEAAGAAGQIGVGAIVARRMFSLGQEIRLIYENVERFQRDLNLLQVQVAGSKLFDSNINSNALANKSDSMTAAGLEPAGMEAKKMRIQELLDQLNGRAESVGADGTRVEEMMGLRGRLNRANTSQGIVELSKIFEVDTYRTDSLASEERKLTAELQSLLRQQDGQKARSTAAGQGLRVLNTSTIPLAQSTMQSQQGTPLGTGGPTSQQIDENNALLKQLAQEMRRFAPSAGLYGNVR